MKLNYIRKTNKCYRIISVVRDNKTEVQGISSFYISDDLKPFVVEIKGDNSYSAIALDFLATDLSKLQELYELSDVTDSLVINEKVTPILLSDENRKMIMFQLIKDVLKDYDNVVFAFDDNYADTFYVKQEPDYVLLPSKYQLNTRAPEMRQKTIVKFKPSEIKSSYKNQLAYTAHLNQIRKDLREKIEERLAQ